MEGRTCPPGFSPEQFAEAQRLMEITEQAHADERWRMCCLLASKKNSQLFGQTEFELRDIVHRVGAVTLQAAAHERRKKGATTAAVSLALAGTTADLATTTPSSSAGGRGRSPACSG
jgi:hypothetical protein